MLKSRGAHQRGLNLFATGLAVRMPKSHANEVLGIGDHAGALHFSKKVFRSRGQMAIADSSQVEALLVIIRSAERDLPTMFLGEHDVILSKGKHASGEERPELLTRQWM